MAAGVGEGRAGVAVGLTSGAVGAAVFAFAGGRGVGLCRGVGVGVTGQRIKPLGVTEQPAGMSCMNGL